MPAILAVLTSAIGKFLLKLILSTTSEKFIEWAFFKIAEKLASLTKTPVDDEWVAEIKKNYEEYSDKDKSEGLASAEKVVDAVKK